MRSLLASALVALACASSASASASASASQPRRFPDAPIVLDMAALSHAVYRLRNKVRSCHDVPSNNGTSPGPFHRGALRGAGGNNGTDDSAARELFRRVLPAGTECLHYSHDHSLGTQVLVVRSTSQKYVAVAYAGTDDFRTALMDGDVLTSDFGPGANSPFPADNASAIFEGVPEGVRVHRGFNSAVFDNHSYRAVLDCVASARLGGGCGDDGAGAGAGGADADSDTDADPPTTPYRLFTTGHSLGAADSVLLGATLHLIYPDENMTSVNFGCPKVGNTEWSFWLDSLQPDDGGQDGSPSSASAPDGGKGLGSLEVFRFVNKIDLVPRLPEFVFAHAGHTLQMSVGGDVKAYYDHLGNEDLGYAGVPFGWEAAPYALLPFALASHGVQHYVRYLTKYRPGSDAGDVGAYVRGFERADDDVPPPPPPPDATDVGARARGFGGGRRNPPVDSLVRLAA